MKLYHCRDARSLRPLWALEELGLDYELITMPFPPRYKVEGYLEINPLGTVPTFIDGELTLTESSAICHYLQQKVEPSHRLWIQPSEPDYGKFLNWLYRSDATLTFPQSLIVRYAVFEPEARRQPQVVADYRKWFQARMRCVEQTLDNRDYLCGLDGENPRGRFTIADVCIGFAVYLAQQLQLDDELGPHTKAYLKRLLQRPALQRSLDRQAHLANPF